MVTMWRPYVLTVYKQRPFAQGCALKYNPRWAVCS